MKKPAKAKASRAKRRLPAKALTVRKAGAVKGGMRKAGGGAASMVKEL